MTWSNTWSDILAGGNPRWKVDDLSAKQQALANIVKHCSKNNDDGIGAEPSKKLSIFCPLAGDDPFVPYAHSQGHSVTSIDLVPAAVETMKEKFSTMTSGNTGDDPPVVLLQWVKQQVGHHDDPDGVVWHSERATLYQGDALKKRSELMNQFDAVYDKDSFGALDLPMRIPFCQRLADYVKPGGIVYMEVKNKPEGQGRLYGPPFHVETKDIMDSFGEAFEYVESLGKVYELKMPGMSQMGHILRRVKR